MFEMMLPLAGTPADDGAITHALRLARLFGGRVHLVRVLESRRAADRPTDPVDWFMKKAEAEGALRHAAERLKSAGVDAKPALLEGDPTEHLVDYAGRHAADLVILQAGPERGTLSVAGGELLWRSYLNTMLLRHGADAPPDSGYAKILVALDGSQRAECVLPWVQMIARRGQAVILLTHVVTEPELPRLTPPSDEDRELVRRLVERNREEASRYLEGVRQRIGPGAEARLLQGQKVASALHDLAEAENVDVVVLSAHGYGGESRWPFGDVATSFIDYGRTPLLLVQDMPRVEPVTAGVTAERWGR